MSETTSLKKTQKVVLDTLTKLCVRIEAGKVDTSIHHCTYMYNGTEFCTSDYSLCISFYGNNRCISGSLTNSIGNLSEESDEFTKEISEMLTTLKSLLDEKK